MKTLVEGRYRVDTRDQTLVGMSLGGLFALHTLFNAPASFQRYVVVSPSIWWNNRVILEQETASAKRGDDLTANLFLGGRRAGRSRAWRGTHGVERL